ncbi:hypothetical protein [Nonomuraea lactucae]|uniref:hypothetical protein n=1 Tax=Nonomuraea lactucae TaxID=2249762 RepID=UPI0019661437|nr:hypothetical protein [Nonomuraea lactucae]
MRRRAGGRRGGLVRAHNSVRAALIYQHSTAEVDRRIADEMNVKITKGAGALPRTG